MISTVVVGGVPVPVAATVDAFCCYSCRGCLLMVCFLLHCFTIVFIVHASHYSGVEGCECGESRREKKGEINCHCL